MKELVKNTMPYFQKYIPLHILGYIMGFVHMVVLLIEPQILALLVDKVINPAFGQEPAENSSFFNFVIADVPQDDYWTIFFRLSSVFLIVLVLFFITFYVHWHMSHWIGIKSERELRKDALDKINHASTGLLNEYTVGELMTIANQDPLTLKTLYVDYIPRVLNPIFYITVSATYLFRLNGILMVFPVITGLLFVFVTRNYMRDSKKYYDQTWQRGASLNTEIQESIYGIRTIKAYAREDYQHSLFAEKNEALRNTAFAFGDFRAKFSMKFSVIQNSLYIISMIFGIVLSVHMKMTNGEFTSFLSYLMAIAGQFIGISNNLGEIQSSVVSGKRLFGFLNREDKVLDSYGTKMPDGKPHIKLSHVTVLSEEEDFQTETADGKPAQRMKLLQDINLDIPYGKKIGIMGATGSGKTVLLKTIQTYMEYDSGEISVDGVEIHQYNKSGLIRRFGYAMQEVFLFSNTIEANIAFYDPYADKKKVHRCGKLAEVDEFADRLPDGYATIVGEKGFGLSGGQKQRVSLARAMLKEAPVLVLDDCTSALDLETEKKIFGNIRESIGGCTLLMATHRVSAVKDMDEIIFLEDGKIVERGTHDELLARNGRYADICRKQSGNEVLMDE
jgi:ATP-binding cassette subfamily B protein